MTVQQELPLMKIAMLFITGSTSSTDFPTVQPIQGSLRGVTNAFVLELGPSGDSIIYSTYLGGTKTDNGNAIAIDPQNNAYITGTTTSIDFPTINQFHTYQLNGAQAAFVSKIGILRIKTRILRLYRWKCTHYRSRDSR